jgi:sugar phosphate isomerase/epimerase
MYLSLNNTLTGGRAGWPKLAEIAAQTGFPAVDLATKPALAAGFEATKQLLANLRIKPGITDFPVEFRKDEAAFQADLEKLPEAAQFCAALGCPRMTTWIMSSSTTPKAELRKIYKDRFQAAAEILARSHVHLGLEFLGPLHIRKANPYEFIWRMDEMLEFAKDCGSNVGLLLDSWHWYHAGATVEDIVAAGKSRIIHVQINDSPKLPPEQIWYNERLLPGEGVIDLQAFLKALKKIGYDDALSPEVFGRGLKEMPMEEGARLGLESTRKVLANMEPRA